MPFGLLLCGFNPKSITDANFSFELDAAKYIGRARSPVMVLHSPEDDVIPYDLGRKLFDAALEPKRFVELRGGHNEGFLLSQPDYESALGAFLKASPGK